MDYVNLCFKLCGLFEIRATFYLTRLDRTWNLFERSHSHGVRWPGVKKINELATRTAWVMARPVRASVPSRRAATGKRVVPDGSHSTRRPRGHRTEQRCYTEIPEFSGRGRRRIRPSAFHLEPNRRFPRLATLRARLATRTHISRVLASSHVSSSAFVNR